MVRAEETERAGGRELREAPQRAPAVARRLGSATALRRTAARERAAIWRLAPVASAVLLSLAAYANALRNGFVWDDQILIVENETIRSRDALAANLTSDFFYFDRSPLLAEKRGYYRPLVTLSYMGDYALWGLNPAGYHATNVALHASATALVYAVLRSLPLGRTSAWLGAALFAAHPVHTESVTWISGRTDVLAAVFFLLALWGYLRAFGAEAQPGRRARFAWAAGSALAFALGLLAKEVAIALPAVLATYELCASPRPLSAMRVRAVAERLAPYLAIGAAYAVVRFAALGVRAPANEFVASQGTYAIALTFAKALVAYLRVLLVPYPLSAYYSMPFSHSFLDGEVFLSVLVLGVLAWAAWRTPVGRFLGAWYFWTVLPVSNLVPIGAPKDMGFFMAERFLYLPSVAFCAAVGIALARMGGASRGRSRLALAGTILALYVGIAVARNRDWRDERTFYEKTLARAPFACLLHFNLGLVYRDQGRMAEAEAQMRETLRCDAGISEAHNNLGNLLYLRGDRDGAIEQWTAAVRLKPANFEAWYNLGTVLDEVGRREEALAAYRAFLRAAPRVRDPLIAEVQARVQSWDPGSAGSASASAGP